jgi:DNA modification methylase
MQQPEIIPYDKNAKKHPKKQLELLARVVAEVGWRQNVEVNQKGVIVAGHGRYLAWVEFRDSYKLPDVWITNDKGMTIFGAHDTRELTEEQERMWRLADNQINAMTDVAFDTFLSTFFQAAVTAVKAGGGWYVFHSSSTQDQFKLAMESAGLEVRAQLIWNKPTAALGWGDYRWKHEPFFYGGKKETKLTFYGDRTHATVIDMHKTEKELIAFIKREKRLELEGKTTIWTMKRDKVNEYVHPTQKPVELITYALVNSSKAGDVVLDPFCGSGSTIIAAQKTDRVCFGCELDLGFCDIIIQRYVDYTGNTKIIKNGKEEHWEISTPNVSRVPELSEDVGTIAAS